MALQWEFAHVAGVCDVGYLGGADGAGADAPSLVTCGADCNVSLRHAADPATATHQLTDHADAVTVLAVSPQGDRVVTGGEDKTVRLFGAGGTFERVVTRFALAVRAVAFSPAGAFVACAGDDEGIKLVDVSDASCTLLRTLAGAQRPVKALAFDPVGEYLASCEEDGTVRIFEVSSGDLIHEWRELAPAAEGAAPARNLLAWRPGDGSLLAVPGRDGEVLLFERGGRWREAYRMGDGHVGDVALVTWSPNGLYLLSAGVDECVVLWDMMKRAEIDRHKCEAIVCGASWCGSGNALALINGEGALAVWDRPVPAHLPGPTKPLKEVDMALYHFDAEDSAGDDGVDLPEDSAGGAAAGGISDAEDADDAPPTRRFAGRRPAYAPTGTAPQKAFQPGATAAPEADAAGRRFLAYTMQGCITTRDDGAFHTVEVSFHDTSRSGARIPALTDYFGFTMGALSESGAVLACSGDGKSAATMMYRPFDSWVSNGEWTVTFAAGEEPVAVACGEGFVAVATSQRLLRVFSPSGLQTTIIALQGAVVSMAARGRSLAVVWHGGAPVGEDQQLRFALYDVENGSRLADERLPLSPGATLTWLGFSEEGRLVAGDSAGVVSVWHSGFGGAWTPVFNSTAARSSNVERHWIAGLSGSDIFVVVCKAPETEPRVHPRPILSVMPLALPLLLTDASAGALEEEWARGSILLNDMRASGGSDDDVRQQEADMDKRSLRMLAAACKADKLARAADIASRLHLHASLEGALKLANAMRLVPLAERIGALLQARMEVEQVALEEEERLTVERSQPTFGSQQAAASAPLPPLGRHRTEAPDPVDVAATPASLNEPVEPFAAKRPAVPPKRRAGGDAVANPFAKRAKP